MRKLQLLLLRLKVRAKKAALGVVGALVAALVFRFWVKYHQAKKREETAVQKLVREQPFDRRSQIIRSKSMKHMANEALSDPSGLDLLLSAYSKRNAAERVKSRFSQFKRAGVLKLRAALKEKSRNEDGLETIFSSRTSTQENILLSSPLQASQKESAKGSSPETNLIFEALVKWGVFNGQNLRLLSSLCDNTEEIEMKCGELVPVESESLPPNLYFLKHGKGCPLQFGHMSPFVLYAKAPFYFFLFVLFS